MGQAKRRGTPEERRAIAIARDSLIMPLPTKEANRRSQDYQKRARLMSRVALAATFGLHINMVKP